MALAIAILIWLLAITITAVFLGNFGGSFPPLASNFSQIDKQFSLTLTITGTAFLLSHFLLGYFIFKYQEKKSSIAKYHLGNLRLEIAYGILLVIVFITLAATSQNIWNKIYSSTPKNPIEIEAVAKQFEWQFRYPGSDNQFGKIDLAQIEKDSNPLGLDKNDPDGRDDILTGSELIVPLGESIRLYLRSQDVIHSFFVPNLRVKQDVMPGMLMKLDFQATRLGEYEIACAELCGLGHYRMKAKLKVVSKEDFTLWLKNNAKNDKN